MLEPHPERANEIEQFKVSYPHKLALDFRERTPRDIKSLAREDFGEFRLRPAELATQFSDLRPDEHYFAHLPATMDWTPMASG